MKRIPRAGVWLLGILLIAWALGDPYFRDAEGLLTSEFCLPLAFAVASIVAGAALGQRWQTAGLWLALAILGQAAALQLIEAGPQVRYQHYRLPPLSARTALLAFIALQATVVALGLRHFRRPIRDGLASAYAPWRLAAIGFVFIATSATLSRQIGVYAGELLLASCVQAVNLGNVILVAASLPQHALESLTKKLNGLLDRSSQAPASAGIRLDRWTLAGAAWVVLVSGLLALLSYQRHPHVPDELAYLFQARYMGEGMLAMPAPPVQPAFDLHLMLFQHDRWFSIFPPGWPAFLALGVLVGAPWLVNPVLGGLGIVFTSLLLQELYDRRTARIGTLLLALSPWFVFMAMNFMAHTFTLVCALAAAVAVARLRRSGALRWGWLAGFATGLVGLTRPLDGLTVAVLLGLWSLTGWGRRLRLAPAAVFAMATLMVGGLSFVYNQQLTGSPTQHPIMAFFDQEYGPGANALGFGANRDAGWRGLDPLPGHGPIDVLINSNLNAFAVNVELFGWSTGSLLLIVLFLFSGLLKRSDLLMLAVIVAVVAVHSLYWFSGGPDFGARYWYLIIVPCVALAARGLAFLASESASDRRAAGSPRRARVYAAAFSLCLASLMTFLPWRAIDKYHHYRGMRPEIRVLAKKQDFGKSLVLIRGERHPDYASAAVYNPLNLHADVPIYAWDRSPEVRSQLLFVYRDRPVWLVDGPSLTGDGFKVVAGPLEPAALVEGDAGSGGSEKR